MRGIIKKELQKIITLGYRKHDTIVLKINVLTFMLYVKTNSKIITFHCFGVK